jgi:hypothetical protein
VVERIRKGIHGAGRVLLGLFVLWQLFFLASSAALDVEKSVREHGLARSRFLSQHFGRFVNGEDTVHQQLTAFQRQTLKPYSQVTAQPQRWGLFAPAVANAFSFGALEVRWDNDHLEPGSVATYSLEPLFLLGVNEPEDVHSFLRYKNFRLRKYETALTPMPVHDGGVFEPRTEAWRGRIAESVADDGAKMAAYMRWRWHEYQRQHADKALPPPTQVILHMHAFTIPQPPGPSPWRFTDLGRHPVVRWLPWKREQTGQQALERYNPLTDCYESVP